jgi:acetyltransferase-like isoleucine patch superfamily enzyme
MNLHKYAEKIGELPPEVGLPWSYFEKRGCFLDCRGPLVISADSQWGAGVRVLTESHDIDTWPILGPVIPYGVFVESGAWIGSFAVLAGCRIGAGSIVAAGTVVRGQTVGPDVMVAGNPARVVARWNGEKWVDLLAKASGFSRNLE